MLVNALVFASVLSISLSFDIKLPNGQSSRHPDANRFIDNIRERLHQAIQIYEQTPLGTSIDTDVSLVHCIRHSSDYVRRSGGDRLRSAKSVELH